MKLKEGKNKFNSVKLRVPNWNLSIAHIVKVRNFKFFDANYLIK